MMELEAMTNLFLNTGVTVVVIAYFIYRDNKFMSELQKTLTTLVDTVNALREQTMKIEENKEEE